VREKAEEYMFEKMVTSLFASDIMSTWKKIFIK